MHRKSLTQIILAIAVLLPLFLISFVAVANSATISGTVADASGTALNGATTPIMVGAWQGDPCGSKLPVKGDMTDENGSYTITGLPAGTYYLQTNNVNQSNYLNGGEK